MTLVLWCVKYSLKDTGISLPEGKHSLILSLMEEVKGIWKSLVCIILQPACPSSLYPWQGRKEEEIEQETFCSPCLYFQVQLLSGYLENREAL